MESTTRHELRRKNYHQIEDMNQSIQTPLHEQSHFVDPDLLSTLPIRVSHLPFYSDSQIDFGLRFSEPFPKENFDKIFAENFGPEHQRFSWETYEELEEDTNSCDDTISSTYGDYLQRMLLKVFAEEEERVVIPVDEYDSWIQAGGSGSTEDALASGLGRIESHPKLDSEKKSLLEHSKWCCTNMMFGKHKRRSLAEDGRRIPGREAFWQTHGVLDTCGVGIPKANQDCSSYSSHTSCILAHAAPFDDRVLRSELICITALMEKRMRYHAWKAHRFFPVFVYTLNGPCVRITQAHYDGQFLQLRRTEPIEIGRGDDDLAPVKMLLRWILAEPLDNTRWDDNLEDDGAVPLSSSPSGPKGLAMRV